MSEAQAISTDHHPHNTPHTKRMKGLKRFYSLFRPSSADARRTDKADKKTRKIITGLTKVAAPEKERFIPLAYPDLLKALNQPAMWREGEAEHGNSFMADLSIWRHQTYRNRLAALKESYLIFSPDTDTVTTEKLNDLELRARRHDFMENVGDLLESANFEKITEDDLDLLLTSDSPYGLRLHVDLDAFDDVIIYFRGAGTKIVEYRDWKWALLKKKAVETPIFQRLFVALKLKPQEEQIKELMLREEISREKA